MAAATRLRRQGLGLAAVPIALAQQPIEGGQGLVADVMLDAFGIDAGHVIGDPQRAEEAVDDAMPASAMLGEVTPALGQEDRAVGLGADQARRAADG